MWILIIAILFISDPTLTTDSVAEVMELMSNWDSRDSPYYNKIVVPGSQLTGIQRRCSTKREIANECASYYVHCHPQASWTHLARLLYYVWEFAAVEELKPFLSLRGKCNVRVLHRSVFSKGNYSMGRHAQTRRIGTFSCKCAYMAMFLTSG